MELRLRIISLLAVWNVLVEYRISMPSAYLANNTSETGYSDSNILGISNLRLATATQPSHCSYETLCWELAWPGQASSLPFRLAESTVILGRLNSRCRRTTRTISVTDRASPSPLFRSRVVESEILAIAAATSKAKVHIAMRLATPYIIPVSQGLFFGGHQWMVVDKIHVDRLAPKGLDEDLAPDLKGQPGEEAAVCGGGIGGRDEVFA